MTTTDKLGQRHARSQPPLALAPPCGSVQSLRTKRPFMQSSRHTGEVPPKGAEGEGPKEDV
jgi:hypothetical protein